MKKSLLVLILFLAAFCGAAHAAPTVNCTSPTAGGTFGTTVTFNCSATSSSTVTGWEIYVDSVKQWSTPGPVSSISQAVSGLAAGTRTGVVKAYDSTGAVGSQTISFTVSTAATVTTSCTTPANGGSYTNPVPFSCTATGGTITAWQLYDGSTKMDTTAWSGSTVTGSYTLTTGSRSVQVKAYNSTGALGVYAVTITVNAPGGGGGGSTGGGAVTFDQTLTGLTNNNTSMADAYNTDPNWGWSSWANSPDKWGHISDTPMSALEYPGATTQWWMYVELWFNSPTPTTCGTTTFTDSYGVAGHTHPHDHGHRCIGFNNNTDAQVTKQIDMLRRAGFVGINSNLYEPSRDGGSYDQATQRFLRLGQAYTPMFQVILNWDGGGMSKCLNYSSTDTTKLPNQTTCSDASDYDSTKTAAEIQNDNCSTLPFKDPSAGGISVSTDQASCWGSKEMLGQLFYYYKTYMTAPNYGKWQGKPIITFFSENVQTYRAGSLGAKTFVPDTAWIKSMLAKYTGVTPVFLFRQSGGFNTAGSDGAYIWTVENGTDFYTPNSTLFSSYYKTAKASGKLTMGSVNVGFNNREATWGSGKDLYRRCGQNILFGMDAINAAYNSTTQLPLAEVATFDDHEEGTGVEMGIENCWRINPSGTSSGVPTISGTKLSFNLSSVDPDGPNQVEEHHPAQSQRAQDATIRTVHHFKIWVSDGTLGADGSPKMGLLVDNLSPTTSDTANCWTVVPGTGSGTYSYSIDLSCHTAGLTSGTYYMYAEAVGQSLVHNQMSAVSTAYAVNNTAADQPPVGGFDSALGSSTATTTTPQSDNIVMKGWSADNEDGAPVTKVELYEGATLLGTATLAQPRQDISDSFSRTDWLNSGWTFTMSAAGVSLGSHTYTAKAYDSAGHVSTLTPPQTVTVVSAIPTASMSVDPQTGTAPLAVTVDTSTSTAPSGRTLSQRVVQWGDGNQDTLTGSITSATHTYTGPGTYTINMTVTDSAGATASTTTVVTVTVPNINAVTITSLTDGAFVYSPIRVEATGQVGFGTITKMRIYVDGAVVFEATPNVNPAGLDQYVFASANSNHTITVSVFDGNGVEFKSTVTVFVVSAN